MRIRNQSDSDLALNADLRREAEQLLARSEEQTARVRDARSRSAVLRERANELSMRVASLRCPACQSQRVVRYDDGSKKCGCRACSAEWIVGPAPDGA